MQWYYYMIIRLKYYMLLALKFRYTSKDIFKIKIHKKFVKVPITTLIILKTKVIYCSARTWEDPETNLII
jgi:hypothetical protein